VFSNLLWLPKYLKYVQSKTTKRFSVGKVKVNILALTAVSKSKIRIISKNWLALIGYFLLPTKKRLVVSV